MKVFWLKVLSFITPGLKKTSVWACKAYLEKHGYEVKPLKLEQVTKK